jgi:hypothetical protein
MTNNIIADPQDCPLCGDYHIDFLGITSYETGHSVQLGFWCHYCDSNVLLTIVNNKSKVDRRWTKAEDE